MVDITDVQYVMTVSNKLDRFRIKSRSPYKINFRCPFCGDSQKSRSKARGWILEDFQKQTLHYYCHNCFASFSLRDFLKEIDINVYNNYVAEKYLENKKPAHRKDIEKPEDFSTETAIQFKKNPIKTIKKISQLAIDHPARTYVENRQIPSDQHFRIYYAPKFNKWINSLMPGKINEKMKEEPRLVLPFINKDGYVFGVSARSFDPDSTLRYMSIMFNSNELKVFGVDQLNSKKTYYIVEGAIDSFFLKNSIALAGADGDDSTLPDIENAIYVFDNEPRNAQIHKKMEKLINKGRSICIWPSYIKQKDLNEMAMGGIKDIEKIIQQNTFKGLQAKLQLSSWRKT
jgi:transcription elongation factor Elf1